MSSDDRPLEFRYLGADLEKILEEVAGYQIDLAIDPTLPELGARYLNEKLAMCRNYTNRALHYLQLLKRQERDLRMEMKFSESDLDFKMKEKLADDTVVRQQPSIEDRIAYATVLLREERQVLDVAKSQLLDTEETVKLIKTRLDNLRQTSLDIKLQRQIVRDDREGWGSGEGGYVAPSRNKDRTVADGMQAPVRPQIDPNDLLDPAKRPADMPVPVDSVHASQIASFFNSSEEPAVQAAPEPEEAADPGPPPQMAAQKISYASLLADD